MRNVCGCESFPVAGGLACGMVSSPPHFSLDNRYDTFAIMSLLEETMSPRVKPVQRAAAGRKATSKAPRLKNSN